MDKPKCRLCGSRHLISEAHKFEADDKVVMDNTKLDKSESKEIENASLQKLPEHVCPICKDAALEEYFKSRKVARKEYMRNYRKR